MIVVTAKQMREIEQKALQYDMTWPRLMENAGSAAAAFIRKNFAVDRLNCMVFSGSGNNGGDGLVVARKLHEYGANVLLILVQGMPKTEEAKQMLEFLTRQEVPVLFLKEQVESIAEHMQRTHLIVDAIYGTGYHGGLKESGLQACNLINQSPAAVVALDLPSGVECDTGKVDPHAVRANFTIAFELLKPLHILAEPASYCGKVQIVQIGIPEEAYQDYPSQYTLLTEEFVRPLLPPRCADSHKGDYGKALLLCGSSRYPGAALLAATGALRCGSGLVTLMSTKEVGHIAVTQIPELTLEPLPDNGFENMDFFDLLPLIEQQIMKTTAVLMGCGLPNTSLTHKLLAYLLEHLQVPLVLDATALAMLPSHLPLLQQRRAATVITPHPGEMSTLTGQSISYVQENRTLTAQQFAQKYRIYVVLKGSGTIISSPDGRLSTNTTGNPGLARGGSGDLLAGMLTAFIAQGIAPLSAAQLAVWLHGTAADRTAQELSQYAMLPHDIFPAISQILVEWQNDNARLPDL